MEWFNSRWTPELAMLGGLSLPTGNEAFSSDVSDIVGCALRAGSPEE